MYKGYKINIKTNICLYKGKSSKIHILAATALGCKEESDEAAWQLPYLATLTLSGSRTPMVTGA
jgi:hypothetical protein